MQFSISAPQQVTLPNGDVLSFRVNAQDSSLCEIHIGGADHNDVAGTHILTFKRNGLPQDTAFAATLVAPGQPGYKTNAPLTPEQVEANRVAQAQGKVAPYASVNDGAVRADDWQSGSAPADYQGLNQPSPSGYGSANQRNLTPAEIEAKRLADQRAGRGNVNTSGQFHQSPTGAPIPDRPTGQPAPSNPRP